MRLALGDPILKPRLQREMTMGRRLAHVNMAVVGTQLIVAPVWLLVSMISSSVLGTEPGDPSASRYLAQYRGAFLFETPWWVLLLAALPHAVLIWLGRRESRWYTNFYVTDGGGIVTVFASPMWFGVFSIIYAAFIFRSSMYYTTAEEWPGLYSVPFAVALAVGVAGLIVEGATISKATRKRERQKRVRRERALQKRAQQKAMESGPTELLG